MKEEEATTFASWAVVELMGHRRLAGRASEQQIAGTNMLRIDIPIDAETFMTQFYGASAIYCITPTTEEIARAVAARNKPQPVFTYELPAPAPIRSPAVAGTPADVHDRDYNEPPYIHVPIGPDDFDDDDDDGEMGEGWKQEQDATAF